MRRGGWILSALALGCLASAGGCSGQKPEAPPAVSPPRARINDHTWNVTVVSTRLARYRGLSGRSHLPDDEGMLFLFPREAPREFCMRGCLIPIDIAFLDSDLRIVRMYTMEVEADRRGTRGYPSVEPAQFALEVAGGALARAGARVGQKVELLGDLPDPAKAEPSG